MRVSLALILIGGFFAANAESGVFRTICKKLLDIQNPPRTIGVLPFVQQGELGRYYLARITNPLDGFLSISNIYGPNFVTRASQGRNLYFFGEDAAVQKILGETSNPSADNFSKARTQFKPLSPVNGDHHLLSANGAEWKHLHEQLKAAFSPQFFKSKGHFEAINKIVASRIGRLKRGFAAGESTAVQPVLLMREVALEVFLRVQLGEAPADGEVAALIDAGNTISRGIGVHFVNSSEMHLSRDLPNVTAFQRKETAATRTLHDYFRRVLQRNRALPAERRTELMNALLSMSETPGGPKADDDVLVKHLAMFFQASSDTTGSMMSGIFYELAADPSAQEALRTELVGLSLSNRWQLEDLADAPNLDHTMSEAFRFFPSTYMMMRQVEKDTVVHVAAGPVKLEKGDQVAVCPFLAGRSEKKWGMDATGFPAHQFHADRFDSKNLPDDIRPHDASNNAFSRGPRSCLARYFATQEMKIIVGNFLLNFRLAVPPGQKDPHLISGTSLSYNVDMRLNLHSIP